MYISDGGFPRGAHMSAYQPSASYGNPSLVSLKEDYLSSVPELLLRYETMGREVNIARGKTAT